MTLSKFVRRTVALRILAAAAILLSVLQILDLLDVTTEILDRGLGVSGVAYYAALRFPRLIEQVAPLSVLAGGLFAFAQLARESAVIAMRATGVSVYRLIGMAAPAAFLVMIVDYVTVEVIAPRTDPILEAWWSDTAPKSDTVPGPRPFRSGADIVVAQPGDVAGARLTDIKIYRRNPAGAVAERIEAPLATYGEGGWKLHDPKMVRFTQDEAMRSTAAELIWNTNLQPADVQVLLSPQQTPNAASARRALKGGGSERPASYYAVRLQQAFAGPVGILVMLLLSAPV
ncbi:MAG: LptF/LptG family permease, partial [Caulobacteraceae bacterium]